MRIFTRLLTALLIGLGLSNAAVAQEDTIKRIKDEGVLRVAFAESLPMQFRNPATGEWIGYNVDMANDLAEVLGVKLEVVDASWATLIPGLMAGKWDICMVDMFATPVRAATVVFTNPYFVAGWKLMVRSDGGFETWEDLNQPGIVLTSLSGTADEQMERTHFPNAEIKPLVSDNVNSVFLEVANGRADGLLTDEINMGLFIARNPQAKVEILQPERTLSPTGYAYSIRPGDYHFLNFLNTWINFQQTSGKSAEKRKEWIENFKIPE